MFEITRAVELIEQIVEGLKVVMLVLERTVPGSRKKVIDYLEQGNSHPVVTAASAKLVDARQPIELAIGKLRTLKLTQEPTAFPQVETPQADWAKLNPTRRGKLLDVIATIPSVYGAMNITLVA